MRTQKRRIELIQYLLLAAEQDGWETEADLLRYATQYGAGSLQPPRSDDFEDLLKRPLVEMLHPGVEPPTVKWDPARSRYAVVGAPEAESPAAGPAKPDPGEMEEGR